MVCIPAEVEIDDESLIAQMQRIVDEQRKLEYEMGKLREMIFATRVREKGIPKNP